MNLIQTAIQRPIAVVAAVLMTVMFGLLALRTIPIQLAPDVRRPVITITTNWLGGAPAEIEREIINRQEEVLKGLEGMTEIESRSQDGRSRLTLEFRVGQNMDRALLLVANRLDRVTGYPAEVDEPALRTAGAEDQSIAWFVLRRLDGNDRAMYSFGDFATDVIQDRIERVPGIARVDVYGGSERELRVTIHPKRMARYGLTVPDVIAAMRQANLSVSAGDVEEGKRRYVVRAESQLNTVDRVRAVVLRSDLDTESGRFARVTVADIADVAFAYKEPVSYIRYNGEAALGMSAKREAGANVIETMAGVRQAVAELQQGPVANAGLHLRQVYDETVYINSAIDLVRQNIWVGGILAALVLMLFLRSVRATLVISLAIPVSVIGAFVAMAAMGRSINVVSLAGIAFAVGMVVDAAIVVLENIFRLRERGVPRFEAAYRGASQVWSAVLVSALTTVVGVHPHPGARTRGRPVVPRHRRGDLGLGGAVPFGRGDRGAGARHQAVDHRRRQSNTPAGHRPCRPGVLVRGVALHRFRGQQPAAFPGGGGAGLRRCRRRHGGFHAQTRISAQRQPQPSVRLSVAAAGLQSRNHGRNRRRHRGRHRAAVGSRCGSERPARQPAAHGPFFLRGVARQHLSRRRRRGSVAGRRADPLPPGPGLQGTPAPSARSASTRCSAAAWAVGAPSSSIFPVPIWPRCWPPPATPSSGSRASCPGPRAISTGRSPASSWGRRSCG